MENKAPIRILLVIHDFAPRLMNYAKVLDDTSLSVLAVDEWVFERDIDKGFMGEALASELLFPYAPLINGEYLHSQEVILKKRLVLEMLESLVLDFPELSHLLYIAPEYFMFEAILTRARLYPPMMYAMADFTREGRSSEKTKIVLHGYRQALEKLVEEGIVHSSHDYFHMSQDFAATARRRRIRFMNLFKTGQRTLFTSFLGILRGALDLLTQNKDLSVSLQKVKERSVALARTSNLQVEDPENHIYVPTSAGLAPLSSRMDIEEFAREILGADKNAEVSVKSLGGVLNDVYLITANVENKQTKVVVKRFRDWSSFKWFPLTLWSVGTRDFTVLSRSRLEKECAMSQFLYSKGVCVPRLLHLSSAKRLVFMEYVEGENLVKLIRDNARSKKKEELQKLLLLVEKVGNFLANVHEMNVALGDTKPENIIVGRDGEIWFVDFEQAKHNGDRSWDIAEFIYYAGHYVSPFADVTLAKKMAEAFLEGYLKAGGNVRAVKNAGKAKYTKVFSLFTFPNIMLVLSNVCKSVDKQGGR